MSAPSQIADPEHHSSSRPGKGFLLPDNSFLAIADNSYIFRQTLGAEEARCSRATGHMLDSSSFRSPLPTPTPCMLSQTCPRKWSGSPRATAHQRKTHKENEGWEKEGKRKAKKKIQAAFLPPCLENHQTVLTYCFMYSCHFNTLQEMQNLNDV